ncbi:efflux RND transporter periplasmic adaptor subunit [Candidatus Woesebacteria bacterium]|nr:efflux RND transporter periplasmic adaptor subunit [Candidatus Woesebacteria bacterium]
MNKLKNSITTVWKKFKSFSLIKKIIIIAVVIGAGLLIKNQFSSEEVVQYTTSKVARGTVSNIVSETGEIATTSQVSVNSTITGFVSEVYVENGEQVQRGDKLFYVQSNATAEERSSAYASYLKAKDSLEAAKSSAYSLESSMWKAHETFEEDSLDTEKSVDDPIYIETQREWLAAEKKYIDQKAVISQAQAGVTSAWYAYQATIDGAVTAPIAGKVVNMSVANGQQVSSTDAALLIKSDSDTWVTVTITETDISDVLVGQKAIVSIDALDGREISGEVKRVDEIGTVTSGVVTYSAYISLADDEQTAQNELAGVLPAMTVQVDIEASRAENVVVVPNGAIKPYKGGKAVQVVDKQSGELLYMPIEIGIVGITETEVISGISEGDEIVTLSSSKSGDSSQSGGFLNPGR